MLMAWKAVVSIILLAAGIVVPCFAEEKATYRGGTGLDADVEGMVGGIRDEPDPTIRLTKAIDMSYALLSRPRSDIQGLSCATVKGFLAEFEAQPPAVKAYFVRVLGEMGGRARSGLPVLREALAQEEDLNVPNEFGTYPSVQHVADYEFAIGKIEADTVAEACD